jgi:hypothetical protein
MVSAPGSSSFETGHERAGLQRAVLDLVEPGADRLELALDEGRLGGVEVELGAGVLHGATNVGGRAMAVFS